MRQSLVGRTIVVTRPRAQAGGLAAKIAAAGGVPFLFPLLDIVGLEPSLALAAAMTHLDSASLAIFISPNAVAFSVPDILRRRSWPDQLAVAAVGQGTATALRTQLVSEIIVPSTRFDSEALLALPALAASQVAGRQVLLFKGEGGRDFLAATLLERGASVLPVPCYRRLPPSVDLHALLELQAMGQLDAVVISSSEAMRYLAAMCNENGSDLLKNTLFVVPHARIAESAALLGCANIHLTDAGDEGLLAGLSAYNWASLPSHKS